VIFTIRKNLVRPFSIQIDGHLLTFDLDPSLHENIFRRITDFATDVVFHLIHIPILLDKIHGVSDEAISKIKANAENVYHRIHDASS
jgi:hypothetical protein